MNQQKNKESIALSSVFASFALTAMKLVVGILTGSMGIISEAAHSALDLGAAALTYFAVRISDKPVDEKRHYGYGKVESVSALIETGLLFLTSAWIVYEAVHRLIVGKTEVEATWYAFAVIIISIIVDISRSRALNRVAKETKSQALEADALHFSSDIYSSLVVLVGLGFVYFGINGGDSIAAIGVSLFVLVAGYRLGKRTIDVLIDTAPAGLKESVKEIVEKIPEVIAIETLRIRPLGVGNFIDMTIKINRKFSLEKVKEITSDIEAKIREKIPESDIVIHTHPIQLNNETIAEAIQILALRHGLHIHDLVIETIGKKKFISYDLELSDNLTVGETHAIAHDLENSIQGELGPELEINAHVEPLRAEVISSSNLDKEEFEKTERKIKEIAAQVSQIQNVHNILIREIEGKYLVTLHCAIETKTSLAEAHNAASKLEYLLRENLPKIKKAVVHIEPND